MNQMQLINLKVFFYMKHCSTVLCVCVWTVLFSGCSSDTEQETFLEAENTKELCKDGIDNDGDGSTDEDDIECAEFFAVKGDFEENSGVKGYNPIVQTLFTADPAPMVYNDRLYVYTTHDEDELVDDFFTMYNWRVYSTTDLINWTDH